MAEQQRIWIYINKYLIYPVAYIIYIVEYICNTYILMIIVDKREPNDSNLGNEIRSQMINIF